MQTNTTTLRLLGDLELTRVDVSREELFAEMRRIQELEAALGRYATAAEISPDPFD